VTKTEAVADRDRRALRCPYVAQQILTFISASHRENDDEKNIALRQNQGDALTRLAPWSKNVSQKRTAWQGHIIAVGRLAARHNDHDDAAPRHACISNSVSRDA
jgi:hypothetical protein